MNLRLVVIKIFAEHGFKMRFFLVLAIVAAASAEVSQILQDQGDAEVHYEIQPDGSYTSYYHTEDGVVALAQGTLKNNPEGPSYVAVNGNVKYTSPEGDPIVLQYVADENGFQPQGAHLPTPPPVPEAIARSLDYIAKHVYAEQNTRIRRGTLSPKILASLRGSSRKRRELPPALKPSLEPSSRKKRALPPGVTVSLVGSSRKRRALPPGVTVSLVGSSRKRRALPPGVTVSLVGSSRKRRALPPGVTVSLVGSSRKNRSPPNDLVATLGARKRRANNDKIKDGRIAQLLGRK